MKKSHADIMAASRKINLALILSAVIFFSIQTFILNPLYVYTSSNVVFSTTPIPEIITVAEPVKPFSEMRCVGLYDCEV